MNITSAKYHADFDTGVNVAVNCVIDGINHSVPLDLTNRHYAQILKQVEAGTLVIAEAE